MAKDGLIVVVEDDDDLRRIEHQLLEDEGYFVLDAPDGLVGLKVLSSANKPVEALVDYCMPNMDGYRMLQAVVKDSDTLQRHAYVLVTANRQALPPAFEHLLTDRQIPIVDKPFDVEELLETVAEARERVA
jgi:CheY-like chemotaxis protein